MAHFSAQMAVLAALLTLASMQDSQYRQSKSSRLSDDNLQQQRHQPVGRIDLNRYKLSKTPAKSPDTTNRLREIEWEDNSSNVPQGNSPLDGVAKPDQGSVQSKSKPSINPNPRSTESQVKPARRTAKSKPSMLLTSSSMLRLGQDETVENLYLDPIPVSRKESPPLGDSCANCVPEKFLAHYRQMSCIPFVSRECGCAKYFRCPKLSETKKLLSKTNSSFCEHEGKKFRINQPVPMPEQPCRMCQCRLKADYSTGRDQSSRQWKAEIDCNRITVECPEQVFGVKPMDGCYFAYEHDKCCGIEVCPDQLGESNLRRTHKCRYQSREYRFGEQIYPNENSCLRCICDESWNEYDPAGSASCRPIRCSIESDHKVKKEGCTPIYPKDGCCPVDVICDKPNQVSDIDLEESADEKQPKQQANSTDRCWMGGKSRPLGTQIHVVKESTQMQFFCASCICQVPPLFTCKANYDCLIGPDQQTL